MLRHIICDRSPEVSSEQSLAENTDTANVTGEMLEIGEHDFLALAGRTYPSISAVVTWARTRISVSAHFLCA